MFRLLQKVIQLYRSIPLAIALQSMPWMCSRLTSMYVASGYSISICLCAQGLILLKTLLGVHENG
jgi:hypothetical protein